jgi:hypothetical protein
MHRNISLQKGGDKPYNVNAQTLNRFTDPQMEQHMNPVYGLILCENGYVQNLYFLKKNGLLDSFSENFSKNEKTQQILKHHSEIINRACTQEYGSNIIIPTKEIMSSKFTPLDIGRYIAVKYVLKFIDSEFVVKNQKGDRYIVNQKYKKITTAEIENIKKCTPLNKYIDINENDIFAFQIVLFCLWWKANNQDGINDYYKGIQEIFEIFNKYNSEKPPLIIGNSQVSASVNANKSFEELALYIAGVDFMLYSQESSMTFCDGSQQIYSDCGETTVRNIINIFCYNKETHTFDIEILRKKGAIEELITYYTIFNNFNLQSKQEPTEIFNMKLNARNAWSKLIIDKSQHNINFNYQCKGTSGYDMKSGLTIDKTKPNMLQMFNNLFKGYESVKGIEEWTDLAVGTNITEIDTNINGNGFGKIIITNISEQQFEINLLNGHYYVDLFKEKDEIQYYHLSQPQKDILDTLLSEYITEHNFIQINFSSEKLVNEFEIINNQKIQICLFELSLTDKYDSDMRRQIKLDVDDKSMFNKIANKYGNTEKINDYTFLISEENYDFVKDLPALTVLKLAYSMRHRDLESSVKSIDLTPLKNIVKIGNYFLTNLPNLTTIDLTPLKNIVEIGDFFLRNLPKLTTIDLTPLSNIRKIGNNFLAESRINIIDLSSLINLTEIGNYFLYKCNKIEKVDLSASPIISIRSYFLNKCNNLHTVIFNPNPTINSVGYDFMSECDNIKHIDLRCLENIEVINNNFLYDCKNLTTVVFPDKFNKVTYIDKSFIENSPNLKSIISGSKSSDSNKIDLSCFSNVEHIKKKFLGSCYNIESVDLSSLTKLSKIENHFLYECKLLNEVKFSNDANIHYVGTYFLDGCKKLKTIDLRSFKNINIINNNFMSDCDSIVDVKFPDTFVELTEIKPNFMTNTENLENINFSCFSNVEKIGEFFLFSSGIKYADLSSLTKLISVEGSFMRSCFNLETVIMSPNYKIERKNNNFDNCPKLKQIINGDDMSTSTSKGGKKNKRTTRKKNKFFKKQTQKRK